MGINAVRRLGTHCGDTEARVRQNQIGRQNAVGYDFSITIYIADECVDRLDALFQPGRQLCPLVVGEKARDDVERYYPFGRILFAIDIEGDAERAERSFRGLLAPIKLGRIQA